MFDALIITGAIFLACLSACVLIITFSIIQSKMIDNEIKQSQLDKLKYGCPFKKDYYGDK